MAVGGFAAFSARPADTVDVSTTEAAPRPIVPTAASGRVLGAVVAAALTPEPVIEPAADPPSPEVATTSTEAAAETTTAAPKPTTTSKAPDPAPATASATPLDTTAPEIAVSWPEDEEKVTDRVIEFTGTTEPGATVTSGNYSATVDEDGKWKIKLVLLDGRNRAYFTAADSSGNESTAAVVVVYDAPDPTTTTPAPTTTTSTTTTTTTEPPVDGGRRDVEEWRYLVVQYFLPELVEEALVVMECESHGDPLALNSRSGASGLFQFIPNTWNWASQNAGWAGASPFDPEANVASAAWLTEWSLNRGKGAWTHWSCKP